MGSNKEMRNLIPIVSCDFANGVCLLYCIIPSLSTQEHYMSAKEMRKLLCEFINSILTDLDAGKQRTWTLHNCKQLPLTGFN